MEYIYNYINFCIYQAKVYPSPPDRKNLSNSHKIIRVNDDISGIFIFPLLNSIFKYINLIILFLNYIKASDDNGKFEK